MHNESIFQPQTNYTFKLFFKQYLTRHTLYYLNYLFIYSRFYRVNIGVQFKLKCKFHSDCKTKCSIQVKKVLHFDILFFYTQHCKFEFE